MYDFKLIIFKKIELLPSLVKQLTNNIQKWT